MVERAEEKRDVELLGSEGQRPRITEMRIDPGCACGIHVSPHRIDEHDVVPVVPQCRRVDARAAADVDHTAGPGVRADQLLRPLELERPLRGTRRQPHVLVESVRVVHLDPCVDVVLV